jgi:hypothetical protein
MSCECDINEEMTWDKSQMMCAEEDYDPDWDMNLCLPGEIMNEDGDCVNDGKNP